MARSTSIEAYNNIRTNGLLSELRFQVYDALFNGGPMTAQECWHYLRNEAAKRGDARINGITPRFSELKRLGVIYELGEKPCEVTGRNAIVWDISGELPIKLEKVESKDEQIAFLKGKVALLEERLKMYEP